MRKDTSTVESPGSFHAERVGDRRKLSYAIGLTTFVFLVEAVGGYLSGSLSLLSDAGHMMTDLASLVMSFIALRIATVPSSDRFTFGLKRVEILAAFLNGILLLFICAYIGYEAVSRLMKPTPINTPAMISVALIGLIANVISVSLLRHSHNLGVRSAFLHVLGDMLSSIGVVIGGIMMLLFGVQWIDPALSLVIAAVVLFSGYRVLREATSVFLEAAPEHIDVAEIRDVILSNAYIRDVHDLHVWTITSGLLAMSCHVVSESASSLDTDALINDIAGRVRERFGIEHFTIQIESLHFWESDDSCLSC